MMPNDLVEHILVATVRYRSMARYQFSDELFEIAEKLNPWSVGGQIIPFLEILSKQERIPGPDYFNLLTICHVLAPEIVTVVAILRDVDIPEPDLKYVRGEDMYEDV
jgi:hypothetical protein